MNFLLGRVEDGGLTTALGRVPLTDRIRRELEAADAPRELIVRVRPEHFEDASLIDEGARGDGAEFSAEAEVVESMGSDKYVYFDLQAEQAHSADLEELAADAGAADLPSAEGHLLVTRLSAESPVREGDTVKVWFNTDKIHVFDPSTGRNLSLA
jgi:multiple sugar transport system ATP-binding protein